MNSYTIYTKTNSDYCVTYTPPLYLELVDVYESIVNFLRWNRLRRFDVKNESSLPGKDLPLRMKCIRKCRVIVLRNEIYQFFCIYEREKGNFLNRGNEISREIELHYNWVLLWASRSKGIILRKLFIIQIPFVRLKEYKYSIFQFNLQWNVALINVNFEKKTQLNVVIIKFFYPL